MTYLHSQSGRTMSAGEAALRRRFRVVADRLYAEGTTEATVYAALISQTLNDDDQGNEGDPHGHQH